MLSQITDDRVKKLKYVSNYELWIIIEDFMNQRWLLNSYS